MAPTIHLVRHAQAAHNVTRDYTIGDPSLTEDGFQQCIELKNKFIDTFVRGPHAGQPITHLVVSPMLRTMMTGAFSAPGTLGPNNRMIALPELQECGSSRSSTGQSRQHLESQGWSRIVDLERVQPGWNDKTTGSRYASDEESVRNRARDARIFLRSIAQNIDDNAHIVVLSHGNFLKYLPQVIPTNDHWSNAQCRSFHFANLHGNDVEATLVEDTENFKTLGKYAYRLYRYNHTTKEIERDWLGRPLPRGQTALQEMWKADLDRCDFLFRRLWSAGLTYA